jgi:hypothetical protein
MPTERLSMRRIREVLRLRHQGLTERVIARTLGVSNGVAHGYVRRARLAWLAWPLPEGMDDDGLELLLFPAPASSQSDRRPIPDWSFVEKELRRHSVMRPAALGRVSRRQFRRLCLHLVLDDLRGLGRTACAISCVGDLACAPAARVRPDDEHCP